MHEKIKEILESAVPYLDLDTSNDYTGDGLIDSYDVMSIVSELEEAFNITIKGEYIVSEYFKNIDTIADMVEKNRGE